MFRKVFIYSVLRRRLTWCNHGPHLRPPVPHPRDFRSGRTSRIATPNQPPRGIDAAVDQKQSVKGWKSSRKSWGMLGTFPAITLGKTYIWLFVGTSLETIGNLLFLSTSHTNNRLSFGVLPTTGYQFAPNLT